MTPCPRGHKPAITARDMRTLQRAAARRRGFDSFHGPGSAARIADALAGEVGDAVGTDIGCLTRIGAVSLDEATARLMEHHGMDPGVAAAIAHLHEASPVPVEVRVGGVEVASLGATISVMVGDGVWWHAADATMILTRVVPATIVAAAAGRPLSALVSHPALDDLALTIVEATQRAALHLRVGGMRHLGEELVRG